MAISKQRKEDLVSQYREILGRNSSILLTEYSGLTVKETEALREKIREMGGEFFVVKNSLAKRAFEESGWTHPDDAFEGPTAMGAASEDIPGLAKILVDLSKEKETFKIKAGIIDGEIFNAMQLHHLAELPPMPVLQSQFMGVLNMPGSQLAGVLAGSLRQVLNVLQARIDAQPQGSAA